MPEDNVVALQQPEQQEAPKVYTGSIHCSEKHLPQEFSKLIIELERALELPIWMIVQQDEGPWNEISPTLYQGFVQASDAIERDKPAGLLLHSPGGQAEEGYKIMRLFQRRTDKLITIVPLYAKSAATMMALGGRAIVMGSEAELGPLDVQMLDEEDGIRYESALNAVQSLERLNAYALTALDQAMTLFAVRTRKRPDALVPLALQYATSMIGPLVAKIDSVALTKKSRALREAEDYAVRLMKWAGYPFHVAQRIASVLVERYSTHGFVIDSAEAKSYERVNVGTGGGDYFGLGLKIADVNENVQQTLEKLRPHLEKLTVAGRLKEVQT